METVNLSLLPRVAKSTTVSNVLIRRSPRGRTRVCGRPGSKWAMTRATGDESGLSVGADEVQQGGIGPAVRQGVKDARESLRWGNATVTENRAVSADGTVRLLVLSVEDHVDYLEGMKLKRIQKAPRWIDSYKLPGQYIALKELDDDGNTITPQQLLAIACSPYDAREKSALLDASIIEVLVERDGHPGNEKLAGMSPGDVMKASQVLGHGFSSLFVSYVGLLSMLEESRPMLMVGVGTQGIAPLRAVLNWPPVQAMTHPISLIYSAKDQSSAACLQDWDTWRDSGVNVKPVYNTGDMGTDLLQKSIFDIPGGLESLVGGSVDECGVLMSGLKGSTASLLTSRFRDFGISSERLLFCEYF